MGRRWIAEESVSLSLSLALPRLAARNAVILVSEACIRNTADRKERRAAKGSCFINVCMQNICVCKRNAHAYKYGAFAL